MSEHGTPRGIATVRTLAMPKDTNGLGDIFGGWLMSHADVAGAILAAMEAGRSKLTTRNSASAWGALENQLPVPLSSAFT